MLMTISQSRFIRESCLCVAVGRRMVDLQRQIEAKNRLLRELALTDALTCLPNRRAIRRMVKPSIEWGCAAWLFILGGEEDVDSRVAVHAKQP